MQAYDNSPPFVKFETRAVQDPVASKEKGYYVGKDVDVIIIIPRGSGGKLTIEESYDKWLAKVKDAPFRHEMRVGDAGTPMASARFPDEWIEKIEKAYKAWKIGQALPEEGTPILQWGIPSPAQREKLASLHIFTVEQLADATEEALQNFGMGGRDLRQRAKDYLAITQNQGTKVAAEMAELRKQNEVQQAQIQNLLARLENMDAAKPPNDSAVVRA